MLQLSAVFDLCSAVFDLFFQGVLLFDIPPVAIHRWRNSKRNSKSIGDSVGDCQRLVAKSNFFRHRANTPVYNCPPVATKTAQI